MRNLTLIFILIFSTFCRPPQTARVQAPERLDLPAGQMKASGQKALWFVTSNYTTGGRLVRIDLETGLITRPGIVGPDVVLVPDGGQRFFMLSRMSYDAIASVTEANGKLTSTFRLPARANAQWAARDSKGRVWVTTQEENQVYVLDPDLKSQVASIDLSVLRVDDAKADLAQILPIDDNRMAITAQRLHRSAQTWKPDFKSGLAFVDVVSLAVITTTLIDVVNPVALAIDGGPLRVFGGGDFSVPTGANASIAKVNGNAQVTSQQVIDGKVIAVAPQSQAMIVWQPLQKRSCIFNGAIVVHCEVSSQDDGYVFSAVHQAGEVLFVSFKDWQKSELWILSTNGVFPLQRVRMDMPILSFSAGP